MREKKHVKNFFAANHPGVNNGYTALRHVYFLFVSVSLNKTAKQIQALRYVQKFWGKLQFKSLTVLKYFSSINSP